MYESENKTGFLHGELESKMAQNRVVSALHTVLLTIGNGRGRGGGGGAGICECMDDIARQDGTQCPGVRFGSLRHLSNGQRCCCRPWVSEEEPTNNKLTSPCLAGLLWYVKTGLPSLRHQTAKV